MLILISARFGNKWDLAILKNKYNQKCRDVARLYCELVEVSDTDELERGS